MQAAPSPSWEARSYPDPEHDYCTLAGAYRLKQKIEDYWRERGAAVQVTVHNTGFHPAIRYARHDVRSDLVNGMPRLRAVPVSEQR